LRGFVQQRDALAIQALEDAQDFLRKRFQWLGLHLDANGVDLLIKSWRINEMHIGVGYKTVWFISILYPCVKFTTVCF